MKKLPIYYTILYSIQAIYLEQVVFWEACLGNRYRLWWSQWPLCCLRHICRTCRNLRVSVGLTLCWLGVAVRASSPTGRLKRGGLNMIHRTQFIAVNSKLGRPCFAKFSYEKMWLNFIPLVLFFVNGLRVFDYHDVFIKTNNLKVSFLPPRIRNAFFQVNFVSDMLTWLLRL